MSNVTSNSLPSRKLRVGVTIHARQGKQSLWENGIHQNCIFLALLLVRSPVVAEVYLVVCGPEGRMERAKRFLADSPAPLMDIADALVNLDVLIEMGAQLDRDWGVEFREREGKIVSMRVGNDYVIDTERAIFGKPSGMLVTGVPYHMVWTLPQYETIGLPYYQHALRAPVRLLPHLWSPAVLEREIARFPAGLSFGYRPGRRRWRAGIFEPNMCVVKTSFIPLLCCEGAHRAYPDMLEAVKVYNTLHLKDEPAFAGFARALDVVKHGIASFEGRYPLCRVVASDVDAIVTHQWENAQNYVYYEALYGDYPLVHNSHLIGDCGYRYYDFDCEGGAAALQRAYALHDAHLGHYRRTARRFLRGLAPDHEENVHAYTDAIVSLYEGS
ncbi:DUF2827 domain-containing protein [Burkholderia mayonis]|uniref:DUF2827 domain-containing protein n=1 Tax=Burkholderia mayonis TaxID=1385591 RepID=A0A1B4FQJ3_9BURK|nr:DUF2827 domain-containing protein [Burkholderia mayonis]AOJ05926.1 hypothetical protein WS71_00240 [Burkholderia mayonis]KVE54032.1 hypothetical protein WS71_00015 [Burkholderia mayonis]